MPGREYRAYDGSGNPKNYYKDVEGDGTNLNPDLSSVIIKTNQTTGGVTGTSTSGQNKDGNILETLHFLANNPIGRYQRVPLTTSSVNTSSTLTLILEIICPPYQSLSLRIHNRGTGALTALEVRGFESIDFPDDFAILASTTANYTTGNGKQSNNTLIPLVDSSGTLPAIPANGKAGILINIRYFHKIRILASVPTGATYPIDIAGSLMCS